MPTSVLVSCGAKGVQSWKLNSSGVRSSTTLRFKSESPCCGFGNQGALLGVGTGDGRIEIRDGMRGGLVTSLASGHSAVNSLTFGGELASMMCSGHEDGKLRVWNVHSREVVKEFDGTGPVKTCSMRKGDEYVAFGSGSYVTVASLKSNRKVLELEMAANHSKVSDLRWSPFRKSVVAAGCDNGALKVWDVTRPEIPSMAIADAHSAPVSAVRFSPVNHLLFSTASLDKRIRYYDIRVKKFIKVLRVEAPVTAFDFHGSGYRVAAAVSTGQVLMYDLRAGGHTATHTLEANDRGITSVVFRPTLSSGLDQSTVLSRMSSHQVDASLNAIGTPRSAGREAAESMFIFSPTNASRAVAEMTVQVADEESVIIPRVGGDQLKKAQPFSVRSEASSSVLNKKGHLPGEDVRSSKENKENLPTEIPNFVEPTSGAGFDDDSVIIPRVTLEPSKQQKRTTSGRTVVSTTLHLSSIGRGEDCQKPTTRNESLSNSSLSPPSKVKAQNSIPGDDSSLTLAQPAKSKMRQMPDEKGGEDGHRDLTSIEVPSPEMATGVEGVRVRESISTAPNFKLPRQPTETASTEESRSPAIPVASEKPSPELTTDAGSGKVEHAAGLQSEARIVEAESSELVPRAEKKVDSDTCLGKTVVRELDRESPEGGANRPGAGSAQEVRSNRLSTSISTKEKERTAKGTVARNTTGPVVAAEHEALHVRGQNTHSGETRKANVAQRRRKNGLKIEQPNKPEQTSEGRRGQNVDRTSSTELCAKGDPGAENLREGILTKCIEDAMYVVTTDLRSDLRNLHMELLRGFHENQIETRRLIYEQNALNEEMSREVEELRCENRILRARIHN